MKLFQRAAAAFGLAALLACAPCAAESLQFCDHAAPTNASDQDLILRFGSLVREELDGAGSTAVLVARAGLDLHRLHVRYSHAGVALKDNGDLPWTVRQLYYSCDERKPRIFDQGLAGFLNGSDDAQRSWITLVVLPPAAAQSLARAAFDKRQVLDVLGARYSANAYPFSTRYQNCNQWVMELLATAWNDEPADDTLAPRERAQHWLVEQRYAPTEFTFHPHSYMWLGWFVPWLHQDDHPAGDLAQSRYWVSMPLSIETFVHRMVPDAQRIELCRDGRHVVVHHGWSDIADGCVAAPGDRELTLSSD